MFDENLFSSWVEKEKKTAQSGKRKYLHFDNRIDFQKNISFFMSFFSNQENVSKHSFYPFIKIELVTPKFKKTGDFDDKGKPIRKITKKKRPISYCAHFDAYIYSYYSSILTQKYECKIKKLGIYENVTAYLEKGRSNIEFSHEVFDKIKSMGECCALAFDITSFFDGLDHSLLKEMWIDVLNATKLPLDHFNLYKSITKYSFVEKSDLVNAFPELFKMDSYPNRICHPSEFRKKVRGNGLIRKNQNTIQLHESPHYDMPCGIPQGSPISACLSNIYMLKFDKKAKEQIELLGGMYRRYCDDIIVIIDTKHADEIHQFILNEIKKSHLEINDSKTEITEFRFSENDNLRGYDVNRKLKSLQYLGFEFNGKNTYVRSSSMSRYNQRMAGRIRESLKAAYGQNSIGKDVFKKKIYNRYTDKGRRNFISYAKRASIIMNSNTIYKQVKSSQQKVKKLVEEKKETFEKRREKK